MRAIPQALMFDSDDEFRKDRASSLLGLAPARPSLGEDAVLRHERARWRRERKPSPLLAAPTQPVEPIMNDEDERLHVEAESQAGGRLRGPVAGREDGDAVPDSVEPAAGQPPEWSDLPPPQRSDVRQPLRAPAGPASGSSRTRRVVVGMTLAGAALGAALAFAVPRTYVATSEMLIDPRGAQAAGASLSPDAALAFVDNQLRVLRSGTMLAAAAERLNLAADPEFNGAGGALSRVGDLVAGDGAGVAEGSRRQVIETLARAVRTERVGGSSVVAVSAGTSDPQKSALIANTISELFLAGSANAAEATGAMAARLAELRAGVEEAERAVEAYKAENELVDAQGRLITDDEILRLSERLSAARARTVELNARAASTKETDVDSIVTGSLPEQFASPSLAELRARHAQVKQQLDRVSVKLGPRHPERLAAQAELEGARQEIGGELRRVASALQTELRRAVQQEQELASELARMKVRQGDIGGEMVALRELEREAGARRSAYEQALREANGNGRVNAAAGASMISRAEPPLRAAGPSLAGFSLAGGLAGFLAGLGYAGWRRTAAARPHEGATDEAAPQEYAPGEDVHHQDTPAARREDEGKEADDMYPYYPYAPMPHAEPAHATYPQPQQPQQSAYAYPQAGAPAPGYAPSAPGWPQPQAQQPMSAPGWPAAHYPAPPPAYPVMPQHMMMPVHAPHDPWAHLRAYAPPPPQAYAAPSYAPPQPPVHTVVYVPAPPAVQPAPSARHVEHFYETPRSAQRPRAPVEDRFDQAGFVDERTDAAIEEIRRSLREFREAIEDYADDHEPRRGYGT